MLSVAGGEVAFVALMALVFGRTHSAIWGSAALLAVIGTYGLAAPFAGMLGDRFDRRIVMVCSDAAGAVDQPRAGVRARPHGADRPGGAGRDRAVAVPVLLAGGDPEPGAAGGARVGQRRALARQQPRLHARTGRGRRARRDRGRLVRLRVQRGRAGAPRPRSPGASSARSARRPARSCAAASARASRSSGTTACCAGSRARGC